MLLVKLENPPGGGFFELPKRDYKLFIEAFKQRVAIYFTNLYTPAYT